MTEHALNHRFRRYRAETLIIREGRKAGFDPKDLPTEGLPNTQEAVGKNRTHALSACVTNRARIRTHKKLTCAS